MGFGRFHTFFLLLLGVLLGIFLKSFSSSYESTLSESTDVFTSTKIEEAKEILQSSYYQFNEKTKKEIEDGMLSALVNSLGDKHSSYYTPKEAKEFTEMLGGDFEGIGAVIDNHPKGIFIRKVIDESPARRAGLEDGDIIIKVANESMVGVDVEDAVKKIRGPKGSNVVLSYLRGDDEKSIEVTRDTITVPSVQGKILSGSTIGYLEVAFFGENTETEFDKTITKIYSEGAKTIILDFRDNGGGYLDVAVRILSYFLPDASPAVTTRENDPKNTETLITEKNSKSNKDIPIIMLVNSLSASATEIVAGALQDYKRAVILGEKTYGKGSVQEPFLLEDGSIMKITVGRWYTPKDQNIDKDGIKPDVIVPLFDRDYREKYDRQLEAAKEAAKILSSSGETVESTIVKLREKDFTK